MLQLRREISQNKGPFLVVVRQNFHMSRSLHITWLLILSHSVLEFHLLFHNSWNYDCLVTGCCIAFHNTVDFKIIIISQCTYLYYLLANFFTGREDCQSPWGRPTKEERQNIICMDANGVQGWRSGESTRLPPKWPGFDSQIRRQMWIEFVASLLCTERFSPGTPVSPLLKNQNLTCVNCYFQLQCPQLVLQR